MLDVAPHVLGRWMGVEYLDCVWVCAIVRFGQIFLVQEWHDMSVSSQGAIATPVHIDHPDILIVMSACLP